MTPLQLAQRYLEIFCSEGDLEPLADLFTADLCFEGPLQRFASAADYLAALRADPPRGCRSELIYASGDARSACLVYRFHKPGLSAPMAQWFEVRDGRICRILLIFDSAPFRTGAAPG